MPGCRAFLGAVALTLLILRPMMSAAEEVLVPVIKGDWWTVAGDPDLGRFTDAKQQPVDFGIWQANDGTWQLWSCIRGTKVGGKTRLFHRWEGTALTKSNWRPLGIAMQADAKYGETPGGLQAPFVLKHGTVYYQFYGDWENICIATGADGKEFARRTNASGQTGLFSEGLGYNTRDPMVLLINDVWHCYYTAFPNRQGAVYGRTSKDTLAWSKSRVVAFGGQAGTNAYSAECPFVVEAKPGHYYLFRTQRYGRDAKTSVYHSANPMAFGLNEDEKYFVGTLPVAAPEIILHDGSYFIAALLPSLKGIQMARLEWRPAGAVPAQTPAAIPK
ncbi:MAG: hypothetical protein HY674_03010 [Chloroflexi bacterium]|nr:hypothetical protein [Chloroflexota bacterium]